MNDQAVTLVWMAGVIAIMLTFGAIAVIGYARRGRTPPPASDPARRAPDQTPEGFP